MSKARIGDEPPTRHRGGWFDRLARQAARASGRTTTFTLAATLIVAWLVTGPVFHYSDTWQLAINTTTTIVTFLMVFLIQNTQNRDSEAMHIKLNELIRALEGAHVALLDLEELTVQELDRVRERYAKMAARARADLQRGLADTGVPDDGEPPRFDHKGRERGAQERTDRRAEAGASPGGA